MKNKILLFYILFWCLIVNSNPGGTMAETKQVQLPQPKTKGRVSLEEAISKRRSVRNFSKAELSLEEISQLLWAGQGITSQRSNFSFRTAPSAGALYPIEIYFVSKDGLFHYLSVGHSLELIDDKDLRVNLADACLGQKSVKDAAIDIIITGVANRITVKYGQRGIRYMLLEAGHIAQNILLEAVALDLAAVPIGAFDDLTVAKVLGLTKEYQVIYVIAVGKI